MSRRPAQRGDGRPTHPRVKIHYRRIPDQERVYEQRVVLEREDVIVTLSEPVELDAPMTHDGHVMLERGSLALWFTFPDLWHDIARFHTAEGALTGVYANVLTPVVIEGPVWHTSDLFLDLWWPRGGDPVLLDEDEFDQAFGREQIDPDTARRARQEAAALLDGARRGTWPPPVVHEWSLERALAALDA